MIDMQRSWEIDALRGFAVILMIIFNYAFALRFFNVFYFDVGWLFWFAFPRVVAGVFIFIAGISLVISHQRREKKKAAGKYMRRGAKIFSLGLLITAATYLFLPQLTVFFGILHLIGVSIFLSHFFVSRAKIAAITGLLIIAAGIYLSTFSFPFPWLLWLIPQAFATLDYFPLLPWLGVMLLGVAAGNFLFRFGKRKYSVKDFSRNSGIRELAFLGRHSLLVYFLHIPALLVFLSVLGFSLL